MAFAFAATAFIRVRDEEPLTATDALERYCLADTKFAMSFAVTMEMMEDDLYGALRTHPRYPELFNR
jgi:hypothetical protein